LRAVGAPFGLAIDGRPLAIAVSVVVRRGGPFINEGVAVVVGAIRELGRSLEDRRVLVVAVLDPGREAIAVCIGCLGAIAVVVDPVAHDFVGSGVHELVRVVAVVEGLVDEFLVGWVAIAVSVDAVGSIAIAVELVSVRVGCSGVHIAVPGSAVLGVREAVGVRVDTAGEAAGSRCGCGGQSEKKNS